MTRWLLRRPLAILGLMTLGIFLTEPLIADLCDRDGRGAVWTIGATEFPSPDGAAPSPLPPVPDQPTPHHAAHVCHCAHGHLGGLTMAQALHVTPVVGKIAAQQPEQRIMSPTFQPPLRPPIA
jgi:hypothetical protein